MIFEGEYLNGTKWKGNVKEYENNNSFCNGNLLFEGEYLNGKRWNGKGKEFKFEGEYLNGKRNGKGKEFDCNGNIIFEGEYLNGKRNGKGKKYNENKELIFEGEYLFNHKIQGKEYIKEKLIYEGDYFYDRKLNGKGYDEINNEMLIIKNGNGKVKEFNDEGNLIFEGEYLNGKNMAKEKNIIIVVKYFSKVYIWMVNIGMENFLILFSIKNMK